MNSNTNIRISIPKPCHEDWNKFTPDERGAFCKVCSKSVHDFTKKSTEDISTILMDEMSAGKKVCGRFNEDQLTPVLSPPRPYGTIIPSLNPYALNFTRLKKFAMALFLVFGGYLFNSTRSSAQKLMGKVAYIPRPESIKGEISPRYVEHSQDTAENAAPIPIDVKGDVMVEPIETIMGGITAEEISEPLTGDVAVSETIIGDTLVVEEQVVEIMGLVALPYEYSKPSVIDPIPSDSIQQVLDERLAVPESTFVETEVPFEEKVNAMEANALNMECYPNPSKGFLNINYNVKENVSTSIELHDVKGNLIKTLLEPQNMYATDYNTRFDISELADGIYFCTLRSGDNKVSQKIILGR